MAPLRFVDSLLDRITMYRLLIFYLGMLGIAGLFESALGILHFSPWAMGFTAAYIFAVCWLANTMFAWVWNVPVNHESTHITAIILALIISPVTTPAGILFLTAAAGLAIASKYILVINRQHIFNPAAIAVVLTSWGAGQSASWWVGTATMLPFVLAGGILIIRKIRRVQMVAAFVVTALLAGAVFSLLAHQSALATMQRMVLNSALFFLAFVMLTEPLTSPTRVHEHRWYGVLAGLLFPPQVHIFGIYSTPELALVVANVFAAAVSKRVRILPQLVAKTPLSGDIVDFVFKPDKRFAYEPGQYMEWTLPHPQADFRGERRYLTLASSPTEDVLRLGIKFYPNGSSYKKAMLAMDTSTPIAAGQLSGDFVMPKDAAQKLAFIAGGIGVTPFRSMIKYLIDTGQKRDAVLLYAAQTVKDLAYRDIFEQARSQLAIPAWYFVSREQGALPNSSYTTGQITADTIRATIPDYLDRLFYISGPHAMVIATDRALKQLGVPASHIKTDFFPGYA